MRVRRGDRDRGTISIFVALGSAMMLMFLGIVLDCGGELRAIVNADEMAQEAARVGGQQIDQPTLFKQGQYLINTKAAYAAATAFLQKDPAYRGLVAEPPDPAKPPPPLATSITVVVHPVYRTALLGLFGVSTLSIQGTGTATMVVGGQNAGGA
ncbi:MULTISPECIES: hypothetical protein [Kitasatospora]|uniref:Uncharacterized protein n=1 Tax=Kitasatospora acidiphila TaxID=2567942 RepID=A0A540VZH2_9ACTN|nr:MULTISPECIES: hypothetical protein [Kitasatospora]MDH6139702.1 hypothetical protein [Kitasatospora sp. GP30]TQF02169.1 hypothetical protein E6W39_07645 [Kitasatospora acidiphila]